jgi:hypothetical protein
LIATVVGLAFLIPTDPTDIFDFFSEFGAWFWPVVLVLVGVGIIIPIAGRTGDPDPTAPTADEEND